MTDESLLIEGAKQMDIDLSQEQVSKLLKYLALIIKWNKTYNLSAIRHTEDG
ncbi:MAG: 16S rRNA (guanine(527)-N(7))-methyltransferase RsmG, partial [Candidatus Thioglobus sp.]|nr:16S rRNA (guanine(527)-N(7))-methyltransferase RsmG [Candidatus Thioglobus sp.]MBT6279008.1 16S rRNA (guanine(527)-N(7))-methyltransferase RsmG [Candidatus Thioglobus sp.]MBT7127624.1 16S rRNA (guanine(527)-N(7))-methyltransferase RsmG [Candidatus Thioglobus sp.]